MIDCRVALIRSIPGVLMQSTIHVYEVRPRKDKRGVDAEL
jgi:hypothetical protein